MVQNWGERCKCSLSEPSERKYGLDAGVASVSENSAGKGRGTDDGKKSQLFSSAEIGSRRDAV